MLLRWLVFNVSTCAMVVYAIKRKVCLSVRSVTWGTEESAGAENVSRVRFHYNAALISIALHSRKKKTRLKIRRIPVESESPLKYPKDSDSTKSLKSPTRPFTNLSKWGKFTNIRSPRFTASWRCNSGVQCLGFVSQGKEERKINCI